MERSNCPEYRKMKDKEWMEKACPELAEGMELGKDMIVAELAKVRDCYLPEFCKKQRGNPDTRNVGVCTTSS